VASSPYRPLWTLSAGTGSAGIPRLTLITCGGAFDDESKTYQDNVIVTAVPVPGAS